MSYTKHHCKQLFCGLCTYCLKSTILCYLQMKSLLEVLMIVCNRCSFALFNSVLSSEELTPIFIDILGLVKIFKH